MWETSCGLELGVVVIWNELERFRDPPVAIFGSRKVEESGKKESGIARDTRALRRKNGAQEWKKESRIAVDTRALRRKKRTKKWKKESRIAVDRRARRRKSGAQEGKKES